MKNFRFLIASFFIIAVCSAFSVEGNKDKNKVVYAFGFATSFNDTVVYCTTIQQLDSAKVKNGFLQKCESYTYQLKNYLEYDLKKPNYTCMIYYSVDKKKLEKEEATIKNKHKHPGISLVPISPEAFSFKHPTE